MFSSQDLKSKDVQPGHQWSSRDGVFFSFPIVMPFIYLSFNGHLSFFHPLVTLNDAAMNVVYTFLFGHCFLLFWVCTCSFGYNPVIAGSYGNYMFNLLRNCHTISTVAVSLSSLLEWMRIPIARQTYQHSFQWVRSSE